MTHKEAHKQLFPGRPYPKIEDPDTVLLLTHEAGNSSYLAAALPKRSEEELRWLAAEELSGKNRPAILRRLIGRFCSLERERLHTAAGV